MQKLFELIRLIRDTSDPPARKLKGICAQQQKLKEVAEEAYQLAYSEEGGEEEGDFEDDPCVAPSKSASASQGKSGKALASNSKTSEGEADTAPVSKIAAPKKKTIAIEDPDYFTPCRRFTKKGSTDFDDVVITEVTQSKERQELDDLLRQINNLKLKLQTQELTTTT